MQSLLARHLATLPRIDREAWVRNLVRFEVDRYLYEHRRSGLLVPHPGFPAPVGGGAFTIPNGVDANFPHQGLVDSVDFDILLAGVQRDGVLSGCAVTAQGSPNNTVAVASGTVVIADVEVAVASGNVTMTAAHATLPRFDLITVTNAGVKTYTAGTAATIPEFPGIPANSVVLAAIYVPANDNVINSTQIVDKRVTVKAPQTLALIVVPKTADETVSASTAVQDDDHLFFTGAANTIYYVEVALFSTQSSTGGLRVTMTGPASATIRFGEPSKWEGAADLLAEAVEDAYVLNNIGTRLVTLKARVVIAGTSGTVRVRWAQNTAAGTTTLLEGSTLVHTSGV